MTVTMTQVAAGVDTHAKSHTAAVVDLLGAVLGVKTFPATTAGYRDLACWIVGFGPVKAVGVEGTGSYGMGLTRHLLSQGVTVWEVNRPDRQHRRRHGKSDPTDAIAAARKVAAGQDLGQPRCVDGPVETLRNLRVARKSLVNIRIRLANQIRSLLVTAPASTREQLTGLTIERLVSHLDGAVEAGDVEDPEPVGFYLAAGALAATYRTVGDQISSLDRAIGHCTDQTAPPALLELCGVGQVVATDLVVTAGTNPDRVHSEAAFAALCGVSPVQASSGERIRHRLNRGGDRQANAALHRAVIVRLRYHQPTRDYMQRRLAEGKTKREIIRCLKRQLARQVWRILTHQPT